ncbi:unnamed protein product, partial [Ectocarpus sp. 13 AM-2016]
VALFTCVFSSNYRRGSKPFSLPSTNATTITAYPPPPPASPTRGHTQTPANHQYQLVFRCKLRKSSEYLRCFVFFCVSICMHESVAKEHTAQRSCAPHANQ